MSNQYKFFVICFNFVLLIMLIVFTRLQWGSGKVKDEDSDENNRMSHLQLREETS